MSGVGSVVSDMSASRTRRSLQTLPTNLSLRDAHNPPPDFADAAGRCTLCGGGFD